MTGYQLTRKALIRLAYLELLDGQPLTPVRGLCCVCGEPVTVWRDEAVCLTRVDGGRCPGNGKPARGDP